jgi:tetratricopeptide (TPR) repeat protein
MQNTWLGAALVTGVVGLLLVGFTGLGAFLLLAAIAVFGLSFTAQEPASARHFNRGLRLERANQYKEAATELILAVEKSPKNAPALMLLIQTLSDGLQDYDRALLYSDALVNAFPESLAGVASKAACLFDADRFDEVIRLLQVSDFEERGDEGATEYLHLLLGRAFFESGSYQVAAEQLAKGPVRSRKRDDDVVQEFRYWLGVAYLKAGQKRKARTQLAKVYAKDVNFRDVGAYAAEVGLT